MMVYPSEPGSSPRIQLATPLITLNWPSARSTGGQRSHRFINTDAGQGALGRPLRRSELAQHDGFGGRKLATKARSRRALTVVYPPRNKSPLTTSLLPLTVDPKRGPAVGALIGGRPITRESADVGRMLWSGPYSRRGTGVKSQN
jgi:hypothetical protein